MSTDQGDDDGADYICGAETEHTDGPCQFPVGRPDARCHNHPKDGSGPPEGQGSGDPGHTMGDGTGDIQEKLPDGAKPAMKHGLHAVQDDPSGTLAWLENHDPRGHQWVIAKWQSYLVDAPFPPESAKADDLLEVCVMKYAVRLARSQQTEQGFTRQEPLIDDDGNPVIDPETHEPVMRVREWAGNLPTERVAKEARRTLKDLGVLDDPQTKQAEAMGYNEAAKRVAQRVDSEVETDPDSGN